MKTIPVLFLSLVIAFGVALPQITNAATANFFGPIISTQCQCPDRAPDWGCVLQTIQNVVNLGISLSVIFGVIVIAWGGILWMTSSINMRNREQAKTMLTHAVVGLMIALSAWLLVDFVMKVLYNPDAQAGGVQYGPWNTILADGEQNFCLEKRDPPQQPVQTGAGTTNNNGTGTGTTDNTGTGNGSTGVTAGNPTQTTGATGCSNCIAVTVPHKSPAQNGCDLNGGHMGVAAPNPAITECMINSSLHSKLQSVANSVSGWWVTEMWPPTYNHQNSCHANGTCVDANFTNGSTDPAKVLELMNAAKNAGIGVVYEPKTVAQCNALVAGGVPAASLDVVSSQVGNGHFSFYNSGVSAQSGCN